MHQKCKCITKKVTICAKILKFNFKNQSKRQYIILKNDEETVEYIVHQFIKICISKSLTVIENLKNRQSYYCNKNVLCEW